MIFGLTAASEDFKLVSVVAKSEKQRLTTPAYADDWFSELDKGRASSLARHEARESAAIPPDEKTDSENNSVLAVICGTPASMARTFGVPRTCRFFKTWRR
jgi:hypothetical protein